MIGSWRSSSDGVSAQRCDTVRYVTPEPLPPTGIAPSDLLELELSPSGSAGSELVNQWLNVRVQPELPPSWPEIDKAGIADPFPDKHQRAELPGSPGEHLLQCAYGSEKRARRFYDEQVLNYLNPRMREFVGGIDMAFIATADAAGECDASLRAGPSGFLEVLDDRHLAYPEYRGNGVMASLGNISENPHVGILMVDFSTDLIGLHVNGKARIVEDSDLRVIHPDLPSEFDRGRTPERWVVVQVEEAYIHCRKHIPRMVPVARERNWGTDDVKRKGGDYFESKGMARPWHQQEPAEEQVGSRSS